MNDLISREQALNAVEWDTEAYTAINMLPSVDAVKHGHWIPVGKVDADGNQYHICSKCRCGEMHVPIIEVRFCWNCGARMDGEVNG